MNSVLIVAAVKQGTIVCLHIDIFIYFIIVARPMLRRQASNMKRGHEEGGAGRQEKMSRLLPQSLRY
jgi:hypothetical protein